MLGIIGAMEEEVNELLALMDVKETKEDLGYTFHIGTLGNKETVVVQGGIGKVNATVSCTLMIKNFNIDHLINIGTAGGLCQEEEVGDIVIGERVCHHDFDLTGFGRPMGRIPNLPEVYIHANEDMVRVAQEVLKDNDVRAHTGIIASGDQFVHTKEQVDKILTHFAEAMCAEMEAASIGQTCYLFQVPFIITRGLSDIFNKGNNSIQFDEYLKKASKVSAKMCYELAQKL
jgi:adenosylhomocysteine nucleosidase